MSMEVGIEAVQEQILEILQTSPVVKTMVANELLARFGFHYTFAENQRLTDELTCVCQLLVFQRVLTPLFGSQ